MGALWFVSPRHRSNVFHRRRGRKLNSCQSQVNNGDCKYLHIDKPVFMRQRLPCLLIRVRFPRKGIDYCQHVLYIRMTFFYQLRPAAVTQTHFMGIFVAARSTQRPSRDFYVVVALENEIRCSAHYSRRRLVMIPNCQSVDVEDSPPLHFYVSS